MSLLNGGIRIPANDEVLEMEEVEGLVQNGSTNGPNHHHHASHRGSNKHHSAKTPKSRWCLGFAAVGILVTLLFALDIIDLGETTKSIGKSSKRGEAELQKPVDSTYSDDCYIPKDIIQEIVDATVESVLKRQEQSGENSVGVPVQTPKPQEPQAAPATEAPATEPPATEAPATEAPATAEVTPAPVATPAPQQPQEPQINLDFFNEYPNRDVPNNKFPADAWQSNPTSIKEHVDKAAKVVDTAISAILQEYGQDNMTMFELQILDLDKGERPKSLDNGGWTTRRSLDGLIRRCLHAIISQDTFTYVLGGHSAAAGHGNIFHQSYAMQFHVVMEPVFRQLGVKLISRNLAQGGLGTVQSAMGSGDIYGHEVDMISWDSGMTERNADHIDLFMRQALIGGNRVPVLWGADAGASYTMLHQHASADVGQFGTGLVGIPTTTDEEQANTIPWAARFMKCTGERQDLCNTNKFHANCWVDRPDVSPPTAQLEKPTSQVGWHPGFRSHQLTGRVLAMTVLQALKEGLERWRQAGDTTLLPESAWHVSAYYENIRSQVRNLPPQLGSCHAIKEMLPERMCTVPMKGRTEFTPRANPEETSITSLLKPDADGYIPAVKEELLYEGPDVYNPFLHPPKGEVDVVALIGGNTRQRRLQKEGMRKSGGTGLLRRRNLDEVIVVGKGWDLAGEPNGRCGGEYDDVCGRDRGDSCLLSAHHDNRGGLLGNEYSGWLVMDIPKVKEGIIVIKLETWHWPEENVRTKGWTTPNNEEAGRSLKRQAPELCEEFFFDYSINGQINSLNKQQFLEAKKVVQRVVETLTLLDDASFSKGQEQNVEVAFRLRGCGREDTFKLTHVYWA